MFSQRRISHLLSQNSHLEQASTDIDLLRVSTEPVKNQDLVYWKEGLDDSSIRAHLTDKPCLVPTLRIFFFKSDRHSEFPYTTNRLHVRAKTLQKFCTCFNVSPMFLENVLHPSEWAKPGQASFVHHVVGNKTPATVECFYQFLDGWGTGLSNVWFSYDVRNSTSTYLLLDCPERSKYDLVNGAQEDPILLASSPFAVDAYITNECCSSWKRNLDDLRDQLLYWEDNGGEGVPLQSIIHTPRGTEKLHRLNRKFSTVIEDLRDFDERLTFLIHIGNRCISMTHSKNNLEESAIETLTYYRSKVRTWIRWVENYRERTKLMMSLLFSIGSQADSRTNLGIADLTARIAFDTQKDSSSMITIAAVTMVFLPGTFVSAIFSMAFFNAGTDARGRATLEVSPLWWYFPTIAIPLTILVFSVWDVWRRKRQAKADPAKGQPRPPTASPSPPS